MKYLNFKKAFASLAIASILFSSCDKKEEVDVIGDRGQTIVKVMDGGTPGERALAIDFVNTATTIIVADIRRDVPNAAELNKSATVTIQEDSAAVTAAGYTHLPAAWYTLVTGEGVTKTGGVGGTYTVTFAPGQFSVPIRIVIPNATLMDPSAVYGLGFRIVSTDQGRVTTDNVLVTAIGAKNIYDGKYRLTFTNYHPTSNPGYTGGTVEVEMHTVSANCVKIFFLGGFYNPTVLGGTTTAFGAQEPEYCIDPVTNKVTVQNTFPGAVTFYTMAPNFNSYYDPIAKKIFAKFGYNYTGGAFDPATSREWTQEFTYLGPR